MTGALTEGHRITGLIINSRAVALSAQALTCAGIGTAAANNIMTPMSTQAGSPGGAQPRAGTPTGVGGRGWRGDATWRNAVKSIRNAHKNATLDANDLGTSVRPTLEEARDLIDQAGGNIVREDLAGHPPGGVSTHLDPHINFTTASGNKATIYIRPPGASWELHQ